MEIKKVNRNGEVAVLVSGGFGAGWSTCMDDNQAAVLLYHPDIVKLVQEDKRSEITDDLCKKILGIDNKKDSYVCVLGAGDLEIEWVIEGAQFEIEEHDGSETLHIIGGRNCHTA